MTSFVIFAACCAGIVATLFCAFKLGRRLQAGRQAKATAEAQERINKVADADLPHTARRLRSGRF